MMESAARRKYLLERMVENNGREGPRIYFTGCDAIT